MTLAVQVEPDAVVVKVRAAPGARREGRVGEHGGALKIAVQAPPEKGRANQRIAEVLAEALGVAPRAVALVHGETSRDKVFRIRCADPQRISARLRELVPA